MRGTPARRGAFTAHEHLDRTSLIHMNGRVYDPVLGRFLSPDPIVQFPGFSQGWNRYAYVSNTPTSFTDPSGFEAEGWIIYPNNTLDGTSGYTPAGSFLNSYDATYDARQQPAHCILFDPAGDEPREDP